MPIIDAPELANLTFLVGVGDVYFSRGSNSETEVADTFLVTVGEPGEIGDTDVSDRDDEVKSLGMESGKRQSRPADVAFRFTSRSSLEAFVLSAAELLGEARRDVETGDSLEVHD